MSLERLKAALAETYAIDREIGQGGMATVYLAQDLKHDRKVAIKVLRPELAAVIGADRFLTEIKTTANLQHPHILPLFDSGVTGAESSESGGVHATGTPPNSQLQTFLYYVMPFVEGETLRDRLNREKQLPIADAVRIGTEVASALDYAHRHGVIHRDIKPENILLHDGRALVADFGIALAASRAGNTRMTETGMSLGTPHYMSPEQAMGEREITARSDVYALGCVVYEMLCGEPPFGGPTAQAIVAKVLTEVPRPLLPKRHTIPPHVEQAVLTALEKLPADRYESAALFAAAIGTVGAETHARTGGAPRRGGTVSLAVIRRRKWATPLAGAVLLALGLTIGEYLTPKDVAAPPARFTIQIPENQRLSGAPVSVLALSPEGRTLVFTGETDRGNELFTRRLEDLLPTKIPNTEGASEPRFSRDGRWLAFFQGSALRRMPAEGGPGTNVRLPPEGIFTFIWDRENGFIVATTGYTLARLLPSGAIDTIAVPDTVRGELGLVPFDILPDGSILVSVWTSSASFGPVDAVDPETGVRRRVITTGAGGVWYGQRSLVWTDPSGALFTADFDPSSLALSTEVTQLAPAVRVVPGGLPEIAVSPSGAVAYIPAQPTTLVRVGRDGSETVLLGDPQRYHSPRISPDGRRIVYDISGLSRDVWLYDQSDRTSTRLSFQNDGHDPTWMPNGNAVTYMTARGTGMGVFRSIADGSGSAESLAVYNNLSIHAITPDGRFGVGSYSGIGGSWDLLILSFEGSHPVTPFLATQFWESHAALSPDGRWLAYQSNESARLEVYVRRFPAGGGRTLVSQGGGMEPMWARNGRELFYFGTRAGGEAALVAAAVTTAPEFRVLSRTPLFSNAAYEMAQPHANYDIFPDGRSFVMVRQGRLGEIVYLQNWPAMMRRSSP